LSTKVAIIDKQPNSKLMEVSALGMCFFIFFVSVKVLQSIGILII
jgi:hypothetical protein